MADTERATRCAAMIVALNDESGWSLDQTAYQRYLNEITPLLPEHCPDVVLHRVIINYHHDHLLVAALCDADNADHGDAWMYWIEQTKRILRHRRLHWSSDNAIDDEDVLQIAQLELARSLKNFSYASRFSSWAYQVIVQSGQRELRNQQAQKRNQRPDSLEDVQEVDQPTSMNGNPDQHAAATILADLMLRLLANHADPRLVRIFHMCVLVDMRPEDVAPLLQLHPSRVRILLGKARQILLEQPALQTWYETNHP